MSRFSWHNRNHSFPPSLKYVQSSSKILAPPLPDIDDEPWMHFLSPPDEDEEYNDYLHFDAGILAGTDSPKKKSQKFRPHRSGDTTLRHHHGSFTRLNEPHGWIQHENPSMASNTTQAIEIPSPHRPKRRSRRTLSGHRHSWQEPSLDTLEEELPQIVVSDYDAAKEPRSRSDSVVESVEEREQKTAEAVNLDGTAQSPKLDATQLSERPDENLGWMWFAERARL